MSKTIKYKAVTIIAALAALIFLSCDSDSGSPTLVNDDDPGEGDVSMAHAAIYRPFRVLQSRALLTISTSLTDIHLTGAS